MAIIRTSAIMLVVISVQFHGHAQKQGVGFDEQFAPFTGSWKFNSEKSAKNKSLARFEEWTMQIRQDNGVIRIIRTIKIKDKERTDELTYHPDNRGEENPTGFGKEKRKTTTLWNDGKIVMRFTLSTYAIGDFLKQDIVDTWDVSSDGQILTITTEAGEERGNMSGRRNAVFQPSTYKKVFDRTS